MKKIIVFFTLMTFSSLVINAEAQDPAEIRFLRQKDENLMLSISGAYRYLDESQIRLRPGRHSCLFDSSSGDGCASKKTKNLTGEWASQLYSFPPTHSPMEPEDKYLIQDSTMFVTSGVLYPLFFLRGKNLESIKKSAYENIMLFKKDGEFNFWIRHKGITSNMTVVGPLNVSFKLLDFVDKAGDFLKKIMSPLSRSSAPKKKHWDDRIKDKNENPWGKDSYFNIPNDADDTALAVTIQGLMKHFVSSDIEVDTKALNRASEFRDLNRTKRDGRDTWTPPNSGAFLTWLKDESLPPFGSPETGVMPVGINNVDCVVNANVLMAAGLSEIGDMPGLVEADQLLASMIKNKKWIKQCAFYYPQRMMFAYTTTRAYRDALTLKGYDSATRKEFPALLSQILDQQLADGSFFGGYDHSKVLATALATVSLLNLGEQNAGVRLSEYRTGLKKAIHWLIEQATSDDVLNDPAALKWEAGIFFSASEWSIAQWRSEPYTTAIVLEALSKYALAYDVSEDSILNGEKLQLP